MPTDFRISELPTSASFDNLDLMEVSQVDAQSLSGYTSVKKTMNQIGDKINNDIQYAADLNTTDKTIIGAINEVNGKGIADLSDTDITTPTANQVLAYDGNGKVVNKALKNLISKKTISTTSAITVAANGIDTQTFTVNDAVFNMVVGVAITNSTNFALVQCVFWNDNVLTLRVRNLANTSDSYQATICYI